MRLLETAIYVDDIERSARFYESLFGFARIVSDDRFCAFNMGPEQVFLLFRKKSSRNVVILPDGQRIPGHDGEGQTHFAFGIEQSELAGWEEKLAAHGVPVESRVTWPPGGTSIYFRDPDGHLAEIATRGIWPNY